MDSHPQETPADPNKPISLFDQMADRMPRPPRPPPPKKYAAKKKLPRGEFRVKWTMETFMSQLQETEGSILCYCGELVHDVEDGAGDTVEKKAGSVACSKIVVGRLGLSGMFARLDDISSELARVGAVYDRLNGGGSGGGGGGRFANDVGDGLEMTTGEDW